MDIKNNVKVADLTAKLQEKNQEIARITREFSEKIIALQKENARLQKRQVVLSNNDRYKKALRLHANGFSVGHIYRIMNQEYGIDITLDEVRTLVDKVDFLDDDLQDYYNKCKKEFGDRLSIDKGVFANTMYKKFQLLENVVTHQLEKAIEIDDERTVLACSTELKNIYKEMSTVFFKNGFENTIDGNINESIDGYKKTKENVGKLIKFNTKLEVM